MAQGVIKETTRLNLTPHVFSHTKPKRWIVSEMNYSPSNRAWRLRTVLDKMGTFTDVTHRWRVGTLPLEWRGIG